MTKLMNRPSKFPPSKDVLVVSHAEKPGVVTRIGPEKLSVSGAPKWRSSQSGETGNPQKMIVWMEKKDESPWILGIDIDNHRYIIEYIYVYVILPTKKNKQAPERYQLENILLTFSNSGFAPNANFEIIRSLWVKWT